MLVAQWLRKYSNLQIYSIHLTKLMTLDYTFLIPEESDTVCPEETLRGNYSSRRQVGVFIESHK